MEQFCLGTHDLNFIYFGFLTVLNDVLPKTLRFLEGLLYYCYCCLPRAELILHLNMSLSGGDKVVVVTSPRINVSATIVITKVWLVLPPPPSPPVCYLSKLISPVTSQSLSLYLHFTKFITSHLHFTKLIIFPSTTSLSLYLTPQPKLIAPYLPPHKAYVPLTHHYAYHSFLHITKLIITLSTSS